MSFARYKKYKKNTRKISTKLWMTFFIHFECSHKSSHKTLLLFPFVRMTDELMCVNNKLTWKFMNKRSFTRASESFSDDKLWTFFFSPSHLDNVETIIPLCCWLFMFRPYRYSTCRSLVVDSAYLLAFKFHFMIIPSKFHLTDVKIMVSYNLVRGDSHSNR